MRTSSIDKICWSCRRSSNSNLKNCIHCKENMCISCCPHHQCKYNNSSSIYLGTPSYNCVKFQDSFLSERNQSIHISDQNNYYCNYCEFCGYRIQFLEHLIQAHQRELIKEHSRMKTSDDFSTTILTDEFMSENLTKKNFCSTHRAQFKNEEEETEITYCGKQTGLICKCCESVGRICKKGNCLCKECMKNNKIRLGLPAESLINKKGRISTFSYKFFYCGKDFYKLITNYKGSYQMKFVCKPKGDPCPDCNMLTQNKDYYLTKEELKKIKEIQNF